MGSPHQTATCPACGTRAIVDPRTKKVRPHLRKGGVTCDGRVESPSPLARLVPPFVRRRRGDGAPSESPGGEPAEGGETPREAGTPSGPVRIRVDCPVCGRFSAVDPQEIRIRFHTAGSGKRCSGSGSIPPLGALILEGITIAEVRERRRGALAKREPEEDKRWRLFRRRSAAS